ncbi:MAG: hypothetical protein BGP24_23580 [Lysobacterales bacterium 69-70]|nr:hypothetical protein [Xanthomonadaceae bacterium]ODU34362.1 MAG: hypothetical protein ABS97_09760 [Xanthomonadaceae bacterium SCN 69-320]ODV22471.1 MAG: hypothetical protein ABT27_01920 [Xanthomonadaceae bacterium SCN 69-25]OJY96267.1 MAG: hypothetical protein BGP24_23580 [Xanthomonadales bacterium 69-70]
MRAGKGIGFLLAALCAAAPVAADYKDTYSRGIKAAESGDWATVRQRMQEAIADNPEPAQRVRLYGQRWEPYVPQYYLGLAAFNQGDCATALTQWRSAANAGVIGGLPELKSVQDRNTATCESRLAQQPKPQPPRPEPPKSGGTVAPDGDTPKPNPPRPEPPKPEQPKPEQPKPPKPVETPQAQRVPAALLDAFRNYLGGRYADVVRLNPDSFNEPRARAQAYLIRAAARQIQAELDGSAAGLDAARADIRAVRAASPNLTPDPALFSPRFRSLYNATR